ncbi:hypothetical protein [Limosilactobacillus caccae]|uniref:hypothetical protein n=1 Tax=Limosilactobacillus caccae TaxID=1926284 RepID=UPI0009711F42|nr:hypothetical protein [Limosilactobacillus caccae]
MRLHTLGPRQTDSYAAAKEYLAKQKNAGEIILHRSFAEIYGHLASLRGDYMIVPAAYQNNDQEGWGQLHYRYFSQLELVDGIVTTLSPLVLCEKDAREEIAYTHPATVELIRQYCGENTLVRLSSSKVDAYHDFLVDGRYVITSKKLIKPADNVTIIKSFNTRMLWAIYQIGG